MPARLLITAVLALVLALASCTSGPGSSAGGAGSPTPEETPAIADQARIEPGPSASLTPSEQEYAAARSRVRALSIEELAGQVIVARYSGTEAPTDLVRDLHLGGVIVFDDNIASTGQIADSNAALRKAVDRPIMIGVDQEGGVVERVKFDATRFPSFMTVGAADRPELTRAAARGSAEELAGLGFTTVFAPEADVTSGADDPTIASRSAGSDPDLVTEHAIAAADGISSTGLIPVLKHFPGHGSVPADSHQELPVQTRSRAELEKVDLAPFAQAADVGVAAIMVGHIDVRAIDPGVPSSLSHKVVTGVLRDQLGFDGLVVTDALDMAGVQDQHDSASAAVAALRAGADVLLMPPDARAARDGIVAAVEDGSLDRSRLEQAATRSLAHLLHQEREPLDTAAPGSRAEASRELSAAAVTVVAGPCSGNLVEDGIRVLGSADRVEALQDAAREAGVPLGRGSTVALVGYRGPAATADIVVATDTPYVLADSTAPVKIATYGDTPAAMDALVAVLTGKAKAPGSLPVPVPGVPRTGC